MGETTAGCLAPPPVSRRDQSHGRPRAHSLDLKFPGSGNRKATTFSDVPGNKTPLKIAKRDVKQGDKINADVEPDGTFTRP